MIIGCPEIVSRLWPYNLAGTSKPIGVNGREGNLCVCVCGLKMGKVCLSRQLLISFSVNNINQLIDSQKIRFITCSSHWFCDHKKDNTTGSKGDTVTENQSKTIEKSFLGDDEVVKG